MLTIIIALYILARMNAAFSGICAASGRNALINKRGYYPMSMWHGALWGQAAVAVGLLVLGVAVVLLREHTHTIGE